jgi:hypothetical protein
VLKESETMELESLSISLCQPLSAGDQDRRSDRHVAQLALSGQEGPKVAPKRKHTKPQNGIATKTKTQRNPTNIEIMIATPSHPPPIISGTQQCKPHDSKPKSISTASILRRSRKLSNTSYSPSHETYHPIAGIEKPK